MLLFNFAWQPRQSFWEEDLKTSYVIVQLSPLLLHFQYLQDLKTSYVIVQLLLAAFGPMRRGFKNILCYCSTARAFLPTSQENDLKTSYVIVQRV